jgi:RNA polymerase sigma-70 factor (ECF subfamily)
MVTLEHNDLILGNVSSFEAFFKKNYHLACLVALRYIKDEQLAEDIVQETFMYFWEKREELKINRNLKQYLLFAVRNRCVNHLQREKHFCRLLENDLINGLKEDPIEDFSKEEFTIHIVKSINELPPQCKKIFLLAYNDHLTYKEIAATLNLSKNTIKTQMGIAYKILREKLKHYFLSLFTLPIRFYLTK